MRDAISLHEFTDHERGDQRADENDFISREPHRSGTFFRGKMAGHGSGFTVLKSASARLMHTLHAEVFPGSVMRR